MDPNVADRLWRSSCGRYTVEADAGCLARLSDIARRAWPCEIGASLVGTYSDDGFTARIEDSGPVPSDSKRGRMTFVRGVAGLRDYFRNIYLRSSGKRHYVGEWHSHPGGSAFPSGTDDAALQDICRDRKTGCPETVLLLVAVAKDGNTEFGVLVYSRDRGRIELHERKTEER